MLDDLERGALGTVIAASLYGQDLDVRFDNAEVVYGMDALELAGPDLDLTRVTRAAAGPAFALST